MGTAFATCLAVIVLAAAPAARAQTIGSAPFIAKFGIPVPKDPGSLAFTIENAVDQTTGEVYVLESYRLQVFDANGGFLRQWPCNGCYGVDVNPVTGDVYVTRTNAHFVEQYTRLGVFVRTWGGLGSGEGSFNGPWGISADPATGNVYVRDTVNARIQQFASDGTFIRQFGSPGTGPGQFIAARGPAALVFDPGANVVYTTDPYALSISKFDAEGNFLLRFGVFGKGLGQLRWPRNVDVDAAGVVYVTDTDNERIHVFSPAGVAQFTFQGPHGNESGPFHPRSIAINRATGERYVNAAYAFRVDKFDAANSFLFSFGERALDGPRLEDPHGLAVSPVSGDVYVLDSGNFLLKIFSPGGAFKVQTGGSARINPQQPGLLGFHLDGAIDVDPDGRVWKGRNDLHYAFDPASVLLDRLDAYTNPELAWLRTDKVAQHYDDFIRGVAIDPATRDVWLTDAQFSTVLRYDVSGNLLTTIPGMQGPAGIAIGGGSVYVVESTANRVRRFDPQGNPLGTFGSAGSGPGQFAFYRTSGIEVMPSGDLLVADTLNHRVQQLTPGGGFVASLGSRGTADGQFVHPMDIALSPSGDLLYVVDLRDKVQVFCFAASAVCSAQLDTDGDGLRDGVDNCAYVANSTQEDGGRVATPADPTAATPDGIGDPCQCGQLTSPDTRVDVSDLETLRSFLAGTTLSVPLGRCSVAGQEECDLLDTVALAREFAGRSGGVRQVCTAAFRLL